MITQSDLDFYKTLDENIDRPFKDNRMLVIILKKLVKELETQRRILKEIVDKAK